jgi:hypothetical protein
VEAEDFGVWELWKVLNIINIPFILSMLWSVVDTRWRQLVIIIFKDLFAVDFSEDDLDEYSILSISYSSTVVTGPGQIVQGGEWYLVWIFIDEDKQLSHTDSQVGLVELILDVPSEWTELCSFLNECMEEAETEQHLSENLWTVT